MDFKTKTTKMTSVAMEASGIFVLSNPACPVIKHEIDGRSFKKLLLEGVQEQFQHPVFHMWLQRGTKEAMRHGDWKVLRDRPRAPFELYNIKKDPQEKTNLAKQEPKRFKEMVKALEAHMKAAKRVPWQRPDAGK